MSGKGLGPIGLDRVARAAESAVGEDQRAATFMRGLALGALVGAAIAGSTIWQRRQASGARETASDAPPASGESDSTADDKRGSAANS